MCVDTIQHILAELCDFSMMEVAVYQKNEVIAIIIIMDEQTQHQNRQRTSQLSGVQIMFAAILAIGLILAINFSTRLTASRPLNEYYENVEAEIEQLRNEQATLIAERDFSQSDAYVEQWAHRNGKMVRPGEYLVIPVPVGRQAPATPTPVIFVESVTSPSEPEPWTLWWALFFDSPPPSLNSQ